MQQLEIFDPTELSRVMPQHRGMFTINWPDSRGRLNRQCCYPLSEMQWVLGQTKLQPDLYTAQCTLDGEIRQSAFVQSVTHVHADLDTYNIPELAGLSADARAARVLRHCEDTDTLPPSVILSSGRGLYCKWYLHEPKSRDWVGTAVASNREIRRRLASFGADAKAVDVTRLLRITGTVHSRAKREVEIVHLTECDGATVTYDADELARALVPTASIEPPAAELWTQDQDRKPRKRSGGRVFTREGYHWAVIEDCRTIARLRYPGGIVQPGMRDIFGYIMACQLARIYPYALLYSSIEAHASTLLPAGYIAHELRGHCGSLLRRAQEAASGLPDRRYLFSKDKLRELLAIRPNEDPFLRVLISAEEKYRREMARRRTNGVMTREAYEAPAVARRARVIDLRAQEWPWRAIARELGISISEARRLAA
jgi:hypothetical protein